MFVGVRIPEPVEKRWEMGWSDWFRDSNGDKVSSKTESRKDGSSTEHHLRDTGSGRNDHQHIVVERDSSGRTESAHGYPNKSER